MTAVDDSSVESGAWGVSVARVVQDVRRDLGETAAGTVATLLHDAKGDLIGVARIAEAWAEVRQHELEVAARRAERSPSSPAPDAGSRGGGSRDRPHA